MKQIQKTDSIVALLHQRLGAELDVNKVAVFEAIALNTLPLRKEHPLYKGSITDLGILYSMAQMVQEESVPVQIMHDKEPLPIGRVFHAEVKGTELRSLFTVDTTNQDLIDKIEAGTVDQVSVSIMPKHIYNSASGFDYLGSDSTFENVWTGSDNEGNTIGQKGVYGKLVGLDQWFEMSLVGKGGAQNARIVHREAASFGSSFEKLAASGIDPNALVLVAAMRNDDMELGDLVANLTEAKVDLSNKTREIVTLTADNTTLKTENDKLKADLAVATAAPEAVKVELTAATDKLATQQVDLDAATVALKEVAQKILTASGKVAETVPATVTELVALIGDTEKGLAAALIVGGKTKASDEVAKPLSNVGAFRVSGNRK